MLTPSTTMVGRSFSVIAIKADTLAAEKEIK